MQQKIASLLEKFKAFKTRMKNETDLLGQELQKFIVQLNFDQEQKGEMPSTLDFNAFKKQFNQIHNLIMPLVKQLEQQQSSISENHDNYVAVMKEPSPMKKKPKTRRKKKDIDDDLSFLDSIVAVNKKECEELERSNTELA